MSDLNLLETKSFDYIAKLDELDVTGDFPYKNDVLYRKNDGKRLMQLVLSYHQGAVIALDGAWGTGKTTFLKMWMSWMKKREFPVLYYNAWEDDISEEPLISMLQQLKTLNKEDGLDDLFKLGAKVVVGALAEGLVEFSPFGKLFKGMFKGGVKQVEQHLYNKMSKEDGRTKMISEFKDKLGEYVEKVCGLDVDNVSQTKETNRALNQYGSYGEPPFKPLVYIIDELDRCNPHFAVKVLERIKHLFEVPNVVFLLAIDKQQFSYSINGFYGSDKIDSMEYLRRFVDFDVCLSEPTHIDYFAYLFNKFKIDSFLKVGGVTDIDFSNYVRLLRINHISLRKAERIMSLLSAVYVQYYDSSIMNLQGRYDLCFLLAYIKLCNYSLFDKIKVLSLSLKDMGDELENLIPDSFANDNEKEFYSNLLTKALFLYSVDLHIIDSYTNDKDNINNNLFRYKQSNYEAPDKLTVNIGTETWRTNLNNCKESIKNLSFKKIEFKDFDVEDYIVKDGYQVTLLSILSAFDLIGSPIVNVFLLDEEALRRKLNDRIYAN